MRHGIVGSLWWNSFNSAAEMLPYIDVEMVAWSMLGMQEFTRAAAGRERPILPLPRWVSDGILREGLTSPGRSHCRLSRVRKSGAAAVYLSAIVSGSQALAALVNVGRYGSESRSVARGV